MSSARMATEHELAADGARISLVTAIDTLTPNS
jgi:hypothetical protein